MEVTLEQGREGFKGLSRAEKSVPGMCESKYNGSEAREYKTGFLIVLRVHGNVKIVDPWLAFHCI